MRYYLAAAAALALQMSASHAETFVALTADNALSTIDGASGKVVNQMQIDGFGPIVGIDVRPSDGLLYALANDGSIATIDPRDGTVTPKSQLDMALPADVKISVDFNPVADKVRIIGSDGTSLRANVDDGKVTQDKPLSFAATDPASGLTPMVIAAAYTNSIKGAKETTLYDIDGGLSDLVRQAPPNDGILSVVGTLGVDSNALSFDIATDNAGVNTAYLFADGKLYSVDLTNGTTSFEKKIAGLGDQVLDIAVLPGGQMKQAAADATMTGGTGMKADTMQQDDYLPPKAKPMAGDMQPSGKAKKAGAMANYAGDQDAYVAPKKPMKKAGGYQKKAGYDDDYGMRRDAYPRKMHRKGPQCNNSHAHY